MSIKNTLNDNKNPIPRVSPLRKKRIIYSDFKKDLTLNPLSGDIAIFTNENSIKESLKNLILTNKGERLFQPELGSNVTASLFENATPVEIKLLEENIRDVINNFEPRVSIIEVDIKALYDKNTIQVVLYFYTKNSEDSQSVTVFLENIR